MEQAEVVRRPLKTPYKNINAEDFCIGDKVADVVTLNFAPVALPIAA